MNGTSRSMTLEGRWVNTIVFSNPKRRANWTAARNEIAESVLAAKKEHPERTERYAEAQVEIQRYQTLGDKPAGQTV